MRTDDPGVGDGSGGGRSFSAGWSVVPGSGIDDYVGLTGGGSVVGGDRDDPVVDLIDSYSGSLRP